MNFPPSPTGETWEEYLNQFGVPFRFAFSPCHWNVIPKSNFKPWTPDQEKILIDAVYQVGYKITRKMVTMHGKKYFDSFETIPGKGFRIV